jgi:putative FmdB family regulatory protein
MPTYEYVCDKCGNEFEIFQSITAAPEKVCPHCGSEVRRKLSSGVGLLFKGSGFYITDYKKSSSSGEGKPAKEKTMDTKPVSAAEK